MPPVDALLLARIQFGFTISFHIVFPALTIGLASYLAVLEGLWLATRKQSYLDLYQFWIKVFAVAFGMGVVSGIVMAYQFGTNWSEFSRFAGGITGPLLAYEVLTAFFLEAGFLGVMLFGMKRVGPALHFLATCAVAGMTMPPEERRSPFSRGSFTSTRSCSIRIGRRSGASARRPGSRRDRSARRPRADRPDGRGRDRRGKPDQLRNRTGVEPGRSRIPSWSSNSTELARLRTSWNRRSARARSVRATRA